MDNELLLFDRLNIIKDTINKFGEDNFYISFSGGKDSTVLHHLVDMAIPGNKIPRVFINTGIEYHDVVRFVKEVASKDDRVIIITNHTNIRNTLEEYGYPFKSKEHSRHVNDFQKNICVNAVNRYVEGIYGFSCPKILKYQFQDSFKLKLSSKCCDVLKKKNIKFFEKTSKKRINIVGLRMSEGGTRHQHKECAIFDSKGKLKTFKPLNPCSDEWVDWFIEKYQIKLCKLYYPPFNFKRTGCKGCPFSLDLQKQLDVMKELLPNERKQCELLWKPVYDEYRRINYRLKGE